MTPHPRVVILTHPRATATAFERVFSTRRDILETFHDPFNSAFYLGPESMSKRYQEGAAARQRPEFATLTYQAVLDSFAEAEKMGKRVFVKELAFSLFAPPGEPTKIMPSISDIQEPGNPTVLPFQALKQFHFTFLIRNPRRSIPSVYRCTIPPLSGPAGFDGFLPGEAGYAELRRMFDFCVEKGLLHTSTATVIDADDLLDEPEKMIRGYCERVGIDFQPEMLQWSDADTEYATNLISGVWQGFHGNLYASSSLKRTQARKLASIEEENKEWADKFGEDAQRVIRKTVDENMPHYEYLRQFRLGV